VIGTSEKSLVPNMALEEGEGMVGKTGGSTFAY